MEQEGALLDHDFDLNLKPIVLNVVNENENAFNAEVDLCLGDCFAWNNRGWSGRLCLDSYECTVELALKTVKDSTCCSSWACCLLTGQYLSCLSSDTQS